MYGCYDIKLASTAVPGSHPPLTTFPKSVKPLTLPDGITCGAVIEGKNGTFNSPQFPDNATNQSCAWVIRVPDGYHLQLSFPILNLKERSVEV